MKHAHAVQISVAAGLPAIRRVDLEQGNQLSGISKVNASNGRAARGRPVIFCLIFDRQGRRPLPI